MRLSRLGRRLRRFSLPHLGILAGALVETPRKRYGCPKGAHRGIHVGMAIVRFASSPRCGARMRPTCRCLCLRGRRCTVAKLRTRVSAQSCSAHEARSRCAEAKGGNMRSLSVPFSPIEQVTEVLHGVSVADPYRWLEDQNSARTRTWID